MPRLWWFNPENDIALGRDIDNFTPPAAAQILSRAGALLPLWLGNDGDSVDCGGVNAAWYGRLVDLYDIGVRPWDHNPAGMQPHPWGWSRACRRHFFNEGFSTDCLPNDETLRRYRALSHRRTAAAVHTILAEQLPFDIWPHAVEVSDAIALEATVGKGRAVIKAPWSSSGRGILFYDHAGRDSIMHQAAGIIKNQGSVMVELAARRVADFAMLFDYADGKARYRGLSLFETSSGGRYSGNRVDSQANLERLISLNCDYDYLNALRAALPAALSSVIGHDYTGPLGIDMLIDESGMIHPVVEINFRYTMGFVALALSRHVAYPAIFSLTRDHIDRSLTPVVIDSRLVEGCEILTPPGSEAAFTLQII